MRKEKQRGALVKILYVWADKYKNLDRFGVNLGSDVKFSYSRSVNRLIQVFDSPLPEGFFPENIIDVAAIVGENGVGKSNVLEMVCRALGGVGRSGLRSDFLVVYEHAGETFCKYRFLEHAAPVADGGIRLIPIDKGASVPEIRVIYFSNVSINRPRNLGPHVTDISPDQGYPGDRFRAPKITEFEKQFFFIRNTGRLDELDVEAPTHVSINFRDVARTDLLYKYHAGIDGELRKAIREYLRNFERMVSYLSGSEKFVFLMAHNFLFGLVKRGFDASWVNEPTFFQSIDAGDAMLAVKLIIDYMKEQIRNHAPEIEKYREVRTDGGDLWEQVELLEKLCAWGHMIGVEESEDNYSESRTHIFNIDLRTANQRYIEDILYAFRNTSLVVVDWIGMSSGQRAYLNLFSLISFELMRQTDTPVLLCIDEGDLYLHPRWQIEFLNRLLNKVSTLAAARVQLVVTSHSPFLVADLPKQSLTVMTKDDGEPSQDGYMLERETLAGNLYRIYQSPFNVDIFETSAFASRKISALAERIKQRSYSTEERRALFHEVSMIGDEMIKRALIDELKDSIDD